MLVIGLHAQDIQLTRTGKITFHAGSSLEDIDATNNEVSSALNTKTGELVFNVLVKSFHFRRALMEEHFNEEYMQSDKYPKAQFTGKITNLKDADFGKEGSYNVNAEGDLTIHGVTRKVVLDVDGPTEPGKDPWGNTRVAVSATTRISRKDYGLTWNAALETGGVLVGDEVTITLDVQFVKAA